MAGHNLFSELGGKETAVKTSPGVEPTKEKISYGHNLFSGLADITKPAVPPLIQLPKIPTTGAFKFESTRFTERPFGWTPPDKEKINPVKKEGFNIFKTPGEWLADMTTKPKLTQKEEEAATAEGGIRRPTFKENIYDEIIKIFTPKMEKRKEPLIPEQMKELGPITAGEVWDESDKMNGIVLPFLLGKFGLPVNPVKLIDTTELMLATKRFKANQYSSDQLGEWGKLEDEKLLSEFFLKQDEMQKRGRTIGAEIMTGVLEMIPWMGAFLGTDTIARFTNVNVQRAATSLLSKMMPVKIADVGGKVLAYGARGVARTIFMPERIEEAYLNRQIPDNFALTEKGRIILKEAQETPFTAVWKAIGDTLIETLSEESGELLVQGASRLMPKKMAGALKDAWVRLVPGRTGQMFTDFFKKAGYHGLLAEMGEERLGDLSKAVTGIQDFGAGPGANVFERVVASIPTGRQMLVEAAVLSLPMIGQVGVSQVARVAERILPGPPPPGGPPPIVVKREVKQIPPALQPLAEEKVAITELEIRDTLKRANVVIYEIPKSLQEKYGEGLGDIYLTQGTNLDILQKELPNSSVRVKDVNGQRAVFSINDYSNLMKQKGFEDRIRETLFFPKGAKPYVNEDFMQGIFEQLKTKAIEGKAEEVAPKEIITPIEGVELINNSTMLKSQTPKFVDVVKNDLIRNQLKALGIKKVVIEPPYKFGLSEQANISISKKEIAINADATDPTDSILHELGHQKLESLSKKQQDILIEKAKTYDNPKVKGYQQLGEWKEVIADSLFKRPDFAPDIYNRAVGKPTEEGKQILIPGTPQRAVPTTPLQAKVGQAEPGKLLEGFQPTKEEPVLPLGTQPVAVPIIEETKIKITVRQRTKEGGKLVDIEVPKSIADKIPNNWTFVSKIEGLPKELQDKYSMFYNTGEEIKPKVLTGEPAVEDKLSTAMKNLELLKHHHNPKISGPASQAIEILKSGDMSKVKNFISTLESVAFKVNNEEADYLYQIRDAMNGVIKKEEAISAVKKAIPAEAAEKLKKMDTQSLEKIIDARYEANAPQAELNELEDIYSERVTEEELGISEGVSLDEQLRNMYHQYITPADRQGMDEAGILENMRSAIWTASVETGSQVKEGITDEQILAAAKDLYEHRQRLIEKLKKEKAKVPAPKRPKNLYSAIIAQGKINPKSFIPFAGTYKELTQIVPISILGKGVEHGLDTMAAALQSEGAIKIPEGEMGERYLWDLLRNKKLEIYTAQENLDKWAEKEMARLEEKYGKEGLRERFGEVEKTIENEVSTQVQNESLVDSAKGIDYTLTEAEEEMGEGGKVTELGSPRYEFAGDEADDISDEIEKREVENENVVYKTGFMPGMVALVKEMLGQPPIVKRLRSNWGLFTGVEGMGLANIKIVPKLFKNLARAARVLAHEIGHWADWIPDFTTKRGNIIGRLLSLKGFLKGTFGELSNKDIRDELITFSKRWSPYDETKASQSYIKKRRESAELYADAISGIIMSPDLLQKDCPQFWKTFWETIDRKPEVKEGLFELKAFLESGDEAMGKVLLDRAREMFKEGDKQYAKVRRESVRSKIDPLTYLRLALQNTFAIVENKVEELKKQGIKVNPDENPNLWFEENLFMPEIVRGMLQEKYIMPVEHPAALDGITRQDIGVYTLAKRILTQGKEFANPEGITFKEAPLILDALKKELGEEKYKKLEGYADKFYDSTESIMRDAVESGFYNRENYEKMVAENGRYYTTFWVIDHIDRNYITSTIFKRTGTFKGVANTYDATILKMVSVKIATQRQLAKKSLRDLFAFNFSEEIIPADYTVSKIGEKIVKNFKEKPGWGLLELREDGTRVGYYVDPYIADAVDEHGSNAIKMFVEIMNTAFQTPIFRTLHVAKNVGFHSWNFNKDFFVGWLRNPIWPIIHTIEYFKTIPDVASLFKDIPTELALEAQKRGVVSVVYPTFALEREGVKEALPTEDAIAEYLRQRYVLEKLPERNVIEHISNFLDNIGKFIEMWGKIVGLKEWKAYNEKLKNSWKIYEERKARGEDVGKPPPAVLTDMEIDHLVRHVSGSPLFRRRGFATGAAGAVTYFFNPFVQGARRWYEFSVKNEGTRSGYWLKMFLSTILPQIATFAAMLGMFDGSGDDEEEKLSGMYADISDYTLANYHVIPLGRLDDKNKTVAFIRIPLNEEERMIKALFFMAFSPRRTDVKEKIQSMSLYAAGQVPSIVPGAELITNWIRYSAGQNPYDLFYGQPVLTNDEQKARKAPADMFTWAEREGPALKKMGKWTIGKFGISAVYTIQPGDEPWVIAVKASPVLSRYLRFAPSKDRELDIEQMQEELAGAKAIIRIQKKEMEK